MTSVAHRRLAGRLAAAEPDLCGLLGGVHHRGEAGALVRAVTKRLSRAAAASAPEIAFTGFDGDAVGRLLRWDRSVHLYFPTVALCYCPRERAASPGGATLCEPCPAYKPGRGQRGSAEATDGGLYRNRRR